MAFSVHAKFVCDRCSLVDEYQGDPPYDMIETDDTPWEGWGRLEMCERVDGPEDRAFITWHLCSACKEAIKGLITEAISKGI